MSPGLGPHGAVLGSPGACQLPEGLTWAAEGPVRGRTPGRGCERSDLQGAPSLMSVAILPVVVPLVFARVVALLLLGLSHDAAEPFTLPELHFGPLSLAAWVPCPAGDEPRHGWHPGHS